MTYEFRFVNQFTDENPEGVIAFEGDTEAESEMQATARAVYRWASRIETHDPSKVPARCINIQQSITDGVTHLYIRTKEESATADEYRQAKDGE